jgi:hypothetical protein
MKALVLITDQPNKNGRIYPRAVMEKAIAEYQQRSHPLPVYRSLAEFEDVQCAQAAREIIGAGTIVQDGSNVYADVAFQSHAIQHQVMLHGLTVRTGGVGISEPVWTGNGTDQWPSGTHTVKEFQLTGLFLTDNPA